MCIRDSSKPEKGADAIFAASKFIVQIQEIFEHFPVHEELGYSTITFGQIQGGYQPYVCLLYTSRCV